MQCPESGDAVTKCDCDECEDRRNCDSRVVVDEKIFDTSELAKAMREKLVGLLGIDDVKLDQIVAQLLSGTQNLVEKLIRESVLSAVEQKMKLYLSDKGETILNAAFDKALEEKITLFTNDNTIARATVQEMVLVKIAKFLDTKDSYNNRDKVRQQIDGIIAARVDGMTKEAMVELKQETIEKFNREIMKKMMAGMASAIASDKRLMAAIDL